MTLKEIREEAWDIARETSEYDDERLWPTREMNRYINRTSRHIARETRCIRDAQTVALCQIPVTTVDYTTYTPGTLDYIWANTEGSWLYQKDVAPYVFALDPRIVDIDECKWTVAQWRLTKVSVKKWQINPWWEQVSAMPTEFCTDYQNNSIALNFRATSDDTLRLTVRRLPLVDLVEDTDTPEFRNHYHDFMVNGVLWQMYSKQDAQAFDGEKAKDYQVRFLTDVDEIKQQEIILDQRLKVNHSMDAFR
jgi:hypothetical protein